MSHPAPARRRGAAVLGTAALALLLAGCAGGGQSTGSSAAAATPTSATASLTGSAEATAPTDPASAAASQIQAAKSASRAEGSQRIAPREALETVGPGVSAGAATTGWKAVAATKNDSVSVMDCTSDVLDQGTLDAVATHIPVASQIAITNLFASRDSTHEFLSCQFAGDSRKSEGMPFVKVTYQHNLDGERLDWCRPEPATPADEFSYDPETGLGLLALLNPGMVGGSDGAPLLPQRTGWACSEDGTELVAIQFGSLLGFGDANGGLDQVPNSPVAKSTTVVTEARDHLAQTVLKDPSHFQDVITQSSPFYLNAQMDEETLKQAQQIPAGTVPEDMLTNQSTIDRPEGADQPVAPGQPPRPVRGSRSSSAAAASASAAAESSASADPAESESASASASPSPTDG